MKLKHIISIAVFFAGLLFSPLANAQTNCCDTKKSEENSACCNTDKKEQTSGCTPSNCRGAQTKFGEAKVITSLRKELISLKARMEESQDPEFTARSYDIHGIVGESDEASIQIISGEVQLIEGEISKKMKRQFSSFTLPANKAKQVSYLSGRIKTLHSLL